MGLIRLLFIETAEIRTHANGTRRSVKMALATTFVGLMPVLMSVLVPRAAPLTEFDAADRRNSLGVMAGGFAGGLFGLRHFAIRLTLWMNRTAPLNYVRFLDYAADRLFLRKVGGGYIFIHRMVLEYFASQDGKPAHTGSAKTAVI